MKDSFILYQSFYQSTKDLPDEQKGELYDAIFQYNAGIEVRELCPVCQMAFNFMKSQFERDGGKYQNVVERNRINGRNGGRPRKNPDEPKKPSGLIGNPDEPKKADTDTVSDTVSDTDNDNVSKDTNTYSSPKTGEVKVEKPISNFYLTKKKRKLSGKRLESFLIFWKKFNYPQGKAEAADSWIDIPELTASLCEKINLAAEMEAKRRPELESAGKTPKMAQGWISSRRWEDEIYIKKVSNPEQSKIQRCER